MTIKPESKTDSVDLDTVDANVMRHSNGVQKAEKSEARKQQNGKTFLSRMKGITIEPMMLLQGIGTVIGRVSTDQMLLYKTCMDPKFNLTHDFCSNIEDHSNSTSYDDVEAEMADFNNIISIAEQVIPIILSFYLGSWSDHWGRKPLLILCMTGKLVAAIMNLLNGIFLSSWSRWVWLATVVGPPNLTGGYLCFVMMTYAFIADNSTARQRTIRLGVLSFCWHVATPISTPLGAWLFNYGGYTWVLSASVLLFSLAWILMVVRLWGFEEPILNLVNKTEKIKFVDMIHPRHIIDTFKVVIKPRPGHKRTFLIIMMATMLTGMFPYVGEMAFEFLYTKRFFSWDVSDFSWYRTIHSLSGSIGMFTLLPLLHKLRATDNITIIIATTSTIGANMFRGLSSKVWMFYASAGVDFASAIVSPPIRAQISRCVSPHELGKVFAMLASVESVVPIIATNTYTRVYKATRDMDYPAPGSCYFISCASLSLGLILTIWMSFKLRCGHVPLSGQPGMMGNTSNLHPEDGDNKDKEVFCLNYVQYKN